MLALPLGAEGLSGNAEDRFFSLLQADGSAIEPRVSRLVLTELLPGLVSDDIDEFGAALTEIQREIGSMFAANRAAYSPAGGPSRRGPACARGRGRRAELVGSDRVRDVESPERAFDVAAGLRAAGGPDVDVASSTST